MANTTLTRGEEIGIQAEGISVFDDSDLEIEADVPVRVLGHKAPGKDDFVLHSIDKRYSFRARNMKGQFIDVCFPNGDYLHTIFYSPNKGSKSVNPVGNWIDMTLWVPEYSLPLADSPAEVRKRLKRVKELDLM